MICARLALGLPASNRSARRPSVLTRHDAVPAPLSRAGRSCQFGRASAPMMPHRVQTMPGPNDGTAMSSGHRSEDRPVVALPAAHVERPHSVSMHVAEGHRRASLRSWSCGHAGEVRNDAMGMATAMVVARGQQ